MGEMEFKERRVLGGTGLRVSRIGLASGYGVPREAVLRANGEYGINYFCWDRRKPGMGQGIARLAQRSREDLVIAIQSYDHTGLLLGGSVEKSLRKLKIDYADILLLGWFNGMPLKRILDTTMRLKDEGKVRFLGMTGHNRGFHGEMAAREDKIFDVLQVRYNAAHRGAEKDVFPKLSSNPPGVVTYTATRWGNLLNQKKMPKGEAPLTAADCYRFVLSNPSVDVCLAGPRSEREMEEGLDALERGPLSHEEMTRIKSIGDHVRG